MAQVKTIRTYNGVPTTSKSWEKLNLTAELAHEYALIQEARTKYERKLVAAIRAARKISDKHDIVLGFRFGPSFLVCDPIEKGATKGALTV